MKYQLNRSSDSHLVHLICRLNPETNRGFGIDAYDKKDPPSWVRNDAKNIFTSGFWVCGTSEATELVGGRLHLHENKTEKSWLSGKVIDVLLINMDFPGRWFVDERDESNILENSLKWIFLSSSHHYCIYIYTNVRFSI